MSYCNAVGFSQESMGMSYNAVLHTIVSTIQAHGPNIMVLLSVTVYSLAQGAFNEEDVSYVKYKKYNTIDMEQ